MAITLILTDTSGTSSSQTVETGTSVAVGPNSSVQIVVDGRVIDPTTTTRTVLPPDVILSLPDGQTVTLTGFVDLTGASTGGLADPDGSIVIASSLEALSAPAAGGTPAGADSAGDNNISTFNQALLGALGGAFGEGTPFEGLDPAAVVASLLESPDPNEFLTALLATLGVTTPASTPATPVTTPATPVTTPATAVTAPVAGVPDTDGTTTPIVGLTELFTAGDDTVDLGDITAVLTQAGLDPADPAALGVFLLAVAAGFNISDALAGNDTVLLPSPGDALAGLVPNFQAGAGDDTVIGGPGSGSETILGGSGNDLIQGRNGGDTLYGDSGNDTIDGDDGSDVLFGGDGQDLLFGDQGGDTMFGDGGDDTIFGGSGEDTLFGGSGNDTIQGSNENDTIVGEQGQDTIIGGNGNDVLGYEAGDGDVTGSLALADLIVNFANGSDLIGLAGGLMFGTGADEAQFVAADTLGLGGAASDTALIITDGGATVTEVLAVVQGVAVANLDGTDIIILP